MAKKADLVVMINESWCKGCGICVEFCPKKVLEIDENGKAFKARPDECIKCRLCEMRCPDLAIFLVDMKSVEFEESGVVQEAGNGEN